MLHLAPVILALFLLAGPIQTKAATVTYSDARLTQYTTTDGNVYEFTDRPENIGTEVKLIITDSSVTVLYR